MPRFKPVKMGEKVDARTLYMIANQVDPAELPAEERQMQKVSGKGIFSHLRYKQEEFVVPARDATGHTQRLYCSVMPMLARQVEIIRSSGKFPFSTTGDLVRWCVYMGVKELCRVEPIKGFLPQIEMMTQALRMIEYQTRYTEYFAALQQSVQYFISDDAMDKAREQVRLAKMQANNMTDEYWKGKMLKGLEKFHYLFANEKKADRLPMDLSKMPLPGQNGKAREQ